MLTSRGWWLLFTASLMTLVGGMLSFQAGDVITLAGLAILSWFIYEWGCFVYQVYFVLPKVVLTREIRDDRKSVPILWANNEFDVFIRLKVPQGTLTDVFLEDCIPFVATMLSQHAQAFTTISPQQPGEILYRIKCAAPGEIIFEGVRLRLTDRQGFFYHRRLLRETKRFPVLPRLVGAEGSQRTTKRHNIFPPPGLHRLRQPGGGSELQDLRDYMPGDPPKMIAWKPSARKDKLITKEFESEVPVRATLFVDASESVRVGPISKSKLTRLANLAAGVAEGIAVDRDHVGLSVFDEYGSQMMRPNRSRTHLIDMLHLLAKAAARPTPLGPFADADSLSKLAYPVANELYPELMDVRINELSPLSNQPAFGGRIAVILSLMRSLFWNPISDTRRVWFVWLFVTPGLFTFFGLLASCAGLMSGTATIAYAYGNVLIPFLRVFGISGWLTVIGFCNFIAFLIWFIHGITGFFGEGRQRRIRRKQLGLLFATLDQDIPGAEVHYLHDDQIFARRAMKFLAEHQARYPVRLHDIRGRYLFYSRPKLAMLADAINYGVSRGRDNELFVILADLVDLADEIDPVLQAVRVAISRHHQVIVMIPWQEDIPPPPTEAPDEYSLKIPRSRLMAEDGMKAIDLELKRDQVERYQKNYITLQKLFGKLGVTVVRAGQEESVQMVLDRLNRMKGRGVRR